MDIKNVKINVDNLEELLTNYEDEIIAIMRPALCQVRDAEGYDEDPEKNEKLKFGKLNGNKFNLFRPSCFGKISYSHLSRRMKAYGYDLSQSGDCIPYSKVANVPFERLQELEEIEKRYTGKTNNSNHENEGDDFMGMDLSTRQKISLAFGDYAEQSNDMVQASLRFDSEFLMIFSQLTADMKGFDKSFLLSFVLLEGLKTLNYSTENVTQETRDNFFATKKKKGE